MKFVDILPVKKERLSPQDFLSLVNTNPSMIKKSRPVFHSLGSRDFLSFDVDYSRPLYKKPKFGEIAR